MSEKIEIYACGEKFHYRDSNFYDHPAPDTDEGREIMHKRNRAYQLAYGVATMHGALSDMFSDIQHGIFRLGKLGGLKGDAFRAFADEVGDACREQKAVTFSTLINIGLFENDLLNLTSNFGMVGEKDDKSLRWVRPEVFVDFDGCVKDARPLFTQNSEYLSCCYGGDPWTAALTLSHVFGGVLAFQRVGSLVEKIIDIGAFAFRESPEDATTGKVLRDTKSREIIFEQMVTDLMFKAIMAVVSNWSFRGILIPCPHCFRGEGATRLNHASFWPEVDACVYCAGTGLVFTNLVKTTGEYVHQNNIGSWSSGNVDFPPMK